MAGKGHSDLREIIEPHMKSGKRTPKDGRDKKKGTRRKGKEGETKGEKGGEEGGRKGERKGRNQERRMEILLGIRLGLERKGHRILTLCALEAELEANFSCCFCRLEGREEQT